MDATSPPDAAPAGRAPNWYEVGAVLVTAGAHLVCTHLLDQAAVFVFAASALWLGYAVARTRREPGVLTRWGFTRRNLGPALADTSVFAGGAFLGIAALAGMGGTLRLPWSLLPLMLLYPLWGLVQQFLVQALVAANLARLPGAAGSPWTVTPPCALLFGLVHLPQLDLALATGVLGLVFTPIYLRYRNLWPLGLCHGWLGALTYVWILERDPWREMFG